MKYLKTVSIKIKSISISLLNILFMIPIIFYFVVVKPGIKSAIIISIFIVVLFSLVVVINLLYKCLKSSYLNFLNTLSQISIVVCTMSYGRFAINIISNPSQFLLFFFGIFVDLLLLVLVGSEIAHSRQLEKGDLDVNRNRIILRSGIGCITLFFISMSNSNIIKVLLGY